MSFANLPFRDLLEAIAAKTPTPGGGAVASITAALAAALGRMVLNYSIGKKSLVENEPANREILETLESIGRTAMLLAEADARAYARLNQLWKLDKDDERRRREFAAAVEGAIAAPRAAMECSLGMLGLMVNLPATTNVMLHSDLAIAAILADAATRSAAWNVRINLPLLEDQAKRGKLESDVDQMIEQSRRDCQAIEQACAGDAG